MTSFKHNQMQLEHDFYAVNDSFLEASVKNDNVQHKHQPLLIANRLNQNKFFPIKIT